MHILTIKSVCISDQVQLRPFDYQIQTKELQDVVVNALSKDHKNRRMIDVSKFSFGFIKAWRGAKRLFLNGATRLFASSYYRDAKIGRTLKEQLRDTYDVTNRMGFVVPYKKDSLLNGDGDYRKPKRRKTNKNDYESEESSVEHTPSSDEDTSEEKRVPITKKKRRIKKRETDLDSLFK